EQGRGVDARGEFEQLAARDFEDIARDNLWLGAMAFLADVCAFLGDTRRAATLYKLVRPCAASCVVIGFSAACLGSASRVLGVLAATMGRGKIAEKHFEQAIEVHTRMGTRPWLAVTQHDYARALLQFSPAHELRARVLLEQAHNTARELGMDGLVQKTL